MAKYTLYGRGESGNTYKAALMLNLCGLDWEPRFVPFFNPDTKAEFKAGINEMGEVPVLEFDGRRLTQSGVILTYLSDLTGRFAGQTDDERLEVLRWLLFDNHRYSSYYSTLRVHFGLRDEGDSPVMEFLREQAKAAFADAEQHLETRGYMVGDRPTIADISMAGYAYYTEKTGIDLDQYPNTRAWAKRIAALPGWKHPYEMLPRALK
jgi:glutathione S-transferase